MVSPQSASAHVRPALSSNQADQALLAWLSISFCPGVGVTLANRLVRECGSPEKVLSAELEQLLAVEGVSKKVAQKLLDPTRQRSARQKALEELGVLRTGGYTLLHPADNRYPARLLHIGDPPALLYCHGNVESLRKPAVAIVGSRAATSYGRRVSFELARELARRGIGVVSGMAMGVDGEAHAGAMAGGGTTIGVLGCGIDVVYPPQHADLFKEVVSQGLLVSEYPPGTIPDGYRFPERNRIISGISLGTVVIEASLKSGSLITAKLALDQGREVFAVPGRIDSPRSRGTHRLIQEGAKLVTGVEDILEELDLSGKLAGDASPAAEAEERLELPQEEQHLLSLLDVYPVAIDELVAESRLDAAAVFQLLLALELKGKVRQLPGQMYERVM